MSQRSAAGSGQKRILLVANTDWYLYNFRLSLARLLREEGWEAVLVSPPGPYANRIRDEGFRWVSLPLHRSSLSPVTEAGAVVKFARLYARERPHLVHHFTIKPVLYGSLVALALGVPGIVNSITGLGHLFLSQRWQVRLARSLVIPVYRAVFRSPRVRLIFENPSDHEFFRRSGIIRQGRSHLIRGVGVDLSRFRSSPEPEGSPVVALPSRLLWEKGTGIFVEAARKVNGRGTVARFVLVGAPDPGNPSSIPMSVVDEWTAEGVVEWWGHRDDMPQVFAACHIVALPSYGEGVPTVLLEASASGRPVVATDIPGCREVVRHGETGMLVPVGDAEALAEAFLELIHDPHARGRMGALARKRAEEHFSQADISRQTVEVYRRALEPRGPGMEAKT